MLFETLFEQQKRKEQENRIIIDIRKDMKGEILAYLDVQEIRDRIREIVLEEMNRMPEIQFKIESNVKKLKDQIINQVQKELKFK